MGKLVISENVTLDGVVEDPTGGEGFRHGGWFSQFGERDREAWAKVEFDEAMGAEAMLLGRRSYDYFAFRWQSRTGEWADRLRSLAKLMEHDLADELRLIVFPVVLGVGERLFGETTNKKPLRLLGTKTIGDSLAYLTYAVVH